MTHVTQCSSAPLTSCQQQQYLNQCTCAFYQKYFKICQFEREKILSLATRIIFSLKFPVCTTPVAGVISLVINQDISNTGDFNSNQILVSAPPPHSSCFELFK